jgi:Fic family protein
MPPEDRHSEALEIELITDPAENARREASNGVRQFDRAVEMVEWWLHPERHFKLRPSALLDLNRIALDGLNRLAGTYRSGAIEITGSQHIPPAAHLVPELTEEMCDYVNENWDRSAIHLASYVMWRLNWIHAFVDGNGRTTRTASFVLLCVRLGYRIPGTNTIPEQISRNKTPYYSALELADKAYENQKTIDVSAMEELVSGLLANQLAFILKEARAPQDDRQPSVKNNPLA